MMNSDEIAALESQLGAYSLSSFEKWCIQAEKWRENSPERLIRLRNLLIYKQMGLELHECTDEEFHNLMPDAERGSCTGDDFSQDDDGDQHFIPACGIIELHRTKLGEHSYCAYRDGQLVFIAFEPYRFQPEEITEISSLLQAHGCVLEIGGGWLPIHYPGRTTPIRIMRIQGIC